MSVKKVLISALAAVCALSLLTPAAFAHGCHSRRAAVSHCAVCAIPSCELAGRHYHGYTLYCGHPHAGGVCDGTCVSLCTVDGCELTGRHYHNGVIYCGTHHAAGYCGGSCPLTQPTRSFRGCHSRHH